MHKLIFPFTIALLAYGFWLSDNFETISAGVAIILFAMLSLEQGFKTFTGGILERILKKATNTVWKSIGFGTITTVLMQSSGLISIITISFLSAGLIDLTAGIGIIFGSNVGTTTGAWLIAGLGLKVNIASYAMPLLSFGMVSLFPKNKTINGIGHVLIGLGLIFLGLYFLKQGFHGFERTLRLSDYAMTGLKGQLVYIVVGAVATAIMQSSHAFMILVITAVSVQQITYENAMALVIGANIGTTLTAIISSLSANIQGKRLAAVHLLFNGVCAVFALIFMKQFVITVDFLADAMGINATDNAMKLAMFDTVFNFAGIVIMLPFVKQTVTFLERLLVEKRASLFKPKYLNVSAVDFPETVVEAVRLESIHLYENAVHIILRTFGLSKHDLQTPEHLWQVIEKNNAPIEYDIDASYEKRIKTIYSAIIAFISGARFTWEMKQSSRLLWLREANRHLVEAIKDTKHLQKNWLRFRTSRNPVAIEEYKKIAYQIALYVRLVEHFRHDMENNELPLLSLDTLKAKIEEEDMQMNRTIEALIREHKIKPETGSSLINDSSYMRDIKSNLVKTAEVLFVRGNPGDVRAQRQLSLDDAEIKQVVRLMGENKAQQVLPEP